MIIRTDPVILKLKIMDRFANLLQRILNDSKLL